MAVAEINRNSARTSAEADALTAKGSMGIAEAADFLGLKRTYIYQLMDAGRLEYARIGKRRLIPRVALERLLASGLTNAS